MNRRVAIVVISVGACGALLAFGIHRARQNEQMTFVPYVPVLIEAGEYVEHPELLTEEHKVRMLIYLPESLKVSDSGQLLIVQRLARDPDLLANFVSKAMSMPQEEVDRERRAAIKRLHPDMPPR